MEFNDDDASEKVDFDDAVEDVFDHGGEDVELNDDNASENSEKVDVTLFALEHQQMVVGTIIISCFDFTDFLCLMQILTSKLMVSILNYILSKVHKY